MSTSQKKETMWKTLDDCLYLPNGDMPPPIPYAIEISYKFTQNEQVYLPVFGPALRTLTKKLPRYLAENENAREYVIEDMSWQEWAEEFHSSEKHAKYIRDVLSDLVYLEQPIPSGLRGFCKLLLRGDIQEQPRTWDPITKRHRNELLAHNAIQIAQLYGMHRGAGHSKLSNEGSLKICGATIAASALHSFGVNVNPPNAVKIVSEHAKSRDHLKPGEFENSVIYDLGTVSVTYPSIGEEELNEKMERAKAYFLNHQVVY